jgi:hypothetical protein
MRLKFLTTISTKKTMISRLALGWITILLSSALAPDTASAIQTQPTEIIVASPLSTFSERAGLWPSSEIPEDHLTGNEIIPLAQALNSIPGLQAREEGSPTLSIRGSAQADRVLKLLEGFPLNFADGFGGSDLFVPREILGSLRLFKGPASVFYGSSAMAGALDFRLRQFERTAVRGALADESGTFGPRSAFAVVPFGVMTSEQRPNAQASIFHEHRPGRFYYESSSGLGSGRRDHNETTTTRATALGNVQAGKMKFKPLIVLSKSTGARPGSLTNPSRSAFDATGSLVGVDAEVATGIESAVGARISDSRIWRKDDSSWGPSSSESSRSNASLDLKTQVFETWTARTFADIRHDALSGTIYPGTKFAESSTEIGQSFEIPLGSTLLFQPATRYLPESGRLIHALGLTHAENQSRRWFLYSEGFRAPSLSDRYANLTGVFVGNPGLRPETSHTFEIGSSLEQGRRFGGFLEGFALELSAHHTSYDDLIDTTQASAPPAVTRVNRGRARAMGGEILGGYGISVWTINVSYTYLDTRDERTGEPLRLSPRHQSVLSLSNQLGPVLIEAKGTYWSVFFDRNANDELRELPGWSTFDLNFRTIGLSDWEMKFGILNLFDSPRELTIGYPEPQRQFYLSALRHF